MNPLRALLAALLVVLVGGATGFVLALNLGAAGMIISIPAAFFEGFGIGALTYDWVFEE